MSALWKIGPGIAAVLLATAMVMDCAPVSERSVGGSAGGSVAQVPVLVYHEISQNPAGETVIGPGTFEEQMTFLAESGYHTLSMKELVAFVRGAPVPEKAVVLTFDDGWKSVETAVPTLKRHGFRATFFIITGAADGRFGPDYLTWDQVDALAKEPLFEVASHSVTHPWKTDDNFLTWEHGTPAGRGIGDVRRELEESKRVLESHLPTPVSYWAWPCGWSDPTLERQATAAGYEAQMTIVAKPVVRGQSLQEIPRYEVDGRWHLGDFMAILKSRAGESSAGL